MIFSSLFFLKYIINTTAIIIFITTSNKNSGETLSSVVKGYRKHKEKRKILFGSLKPIPAIAASELSKKSI